MLFSIWLSNVAAGEVHQTIVLEEVHNFVAGHLEDHYHSPILEVVVLHPENVENCHYLVAQKAVHCHMVDLVLVADLNLGMVVVDVEHVGNCHCLVVQRVGHCHTLILVEVADPNPVTVGLDVEHVENCQ